MGTPENDRGVQQTGEDLRDGFPVFSVTLAGDSPPAGDLLSCFAKKEGKEGDPASPVGLRPTALRCSQRAAGAELALRAQTAAPDFPARCCSAVQTGFHTHRAFTDAASQITGQSHEPLITCISSPLVSS